MGDLATDALHVPRLVFIFLCSAHHQLNNARNAPLLLPLTQAGKYNNDSD